MSGAKAQLAPERDVSALPEGRTLVSYLLHALNQPLTGLQCSLELAVASPRSAEQYVRTLREGLDLVSRVRVLVEAIREVSDGQPSSLVENIAFQLEQPLLDVAAELQPIAEAKGVRVRIAANAALPAYADRARLAAVFFRLLESAISLAREKSDLHIVATAERDDACIAFSWTQDPSLGNSSFSRPEIGLLVARAGWEQAGGTWIEICTGAAQTCTLRTPLCSLRSDSNGAKHEQLNGELR
jgi:signal transduction histidine kinase